MRGQLTLFPVRRRLERSDARRISGRTWPEEEVLQALAGQRAANAGLTGTWPQMVLRLIRCALAIRDAEGEALVAQEMLDQVRLPLKAAAAELLAQAGMLRPRTAPPPAAWPVRSCADCACWGDTATRCRGCREWRQNRERYPVGRCPRCRRDDLPLHVGPPGPALSVPVGPSGPSPSCRTRGPLRAIGSPESWYYVRIRPWWYPHGWSVALHWADKSAHPSRCGSSVTLRLSRLCVSSASSDCMNP